MKTKIFISLSIALIAFCTIRTFAQEKGSIRILDLAVFEPGKIKTFNKPVEIEKFKLKNIVMGFDYNIDIKKEKAMLNPLEMVIEKIQGVNETRKADTTNSDLKNAINELKNYQISNNKDRDEKEIEKLVHTIEKFKNKSDIDTTLKKLAEKWIKTTEIICDEGLTVGRGEKATVTVTRDTLKWTFVFDGGEVGKWITTYGFGFSFAGLNGKEYHTQQTDKGDYKVTKSETPEAFDLNYIPAVFFSYFPAQNFNKGWNNSLSAGLGFDLTAPVVFFGYNGMFYSNIGFSCGAVFQQQNRLKAQYSENDIISSTLDINQLHDKVYRPNIFIAINFRFGENPFKKKEPEEKK